MNRYTTGLVSFLSIVFQSFDFFRVDFHSSLAWLFLLLLTVQMEIYHLNPCPYPCLPCFIDPLIDLPIDLHNCTLRKLPFAFKWKKSLGKTKKPGNGSKGCDCHSSPIVHSFIHSFIVCLFGGAIGVGNVFPPVDASPSSKSAVKQYGIDFKYLLNTSTAA